MTATRDAVLERPAPDVSVPVAIRGRGLRPRTIGEWCCALVVPSAAVGSAFGSVGVAGVELYPFKVLVVVLVAGVIMQHRRMPPAGLPAVWIAIAFGVWAMVTTTWSPAGAAGFQEATIFVFLAGLMVLAIGSIGTTWFPALLYGWPVAALMTSAVGLWEFATGSHLPSKFVADRGGSVSVVLSTFANPNNAGAFFCLSAMMCLVIAAVAGRSDRGGRTLCYVGAGAATVMLPLTASRFALIGLVLGGLVALVLVVRARRGQLLALVAVVLSVPLAVAVLRVSPELTRKLADVAGGGNAASSTSVREALIRNGLDFAIESRGIGIGAAAYEERMLSGLAKYEVFGPAVNPHNLWIEVLSEYGLPGLAAVGLMLLIGLRSAGPLRHPSWFGAAYVGALVGYFFAAMTASSYVNDAVSWTFFSSFIAVGVSRAHARGAAA